MSHMMISTSRPVMPVLRWWLRSTIGQITDIQGRREGISQHLGNREHDSTIFSSKDGTHYLDSILLVSGGGMGEGQGPKYCTGY